MIENVDFKIVATDEDYAQAMAVRRAVFVAEQGIVAEKEYDGNDHSSTHLLAVAGDQPIGTMRIRYFKDFVKFERMCVLKPWRKTDVSERLMRYGMDFAAQKGYDKAYGVCKRELLSRWQKDGFEPIVGAPQVQQNGMTLVPIVCPLPKVKNAISMQTPMSVLNAKEGDWPVQEALQAHVGFKQRLENPSVPLGPYAATDLGRIDVKSLRPAPSFYTRER